LNNPLFSFFGISSYKLLLMKQTLTYCLILLSFTSLFAQPTYIANDTVPTYQGKFGVGVNMGFYANWTNANQAVIAAGDPAQGIKGVGATTIRPGMTADVYSIFGYNLNVGDFALYHQLGMADFTGIIGGPPEWQRDFTNYCPGVPSTLFKDIYLPIWDNSDGTPINEANHFANYMYKVVDQYKDDVTFWEIWNEPGFDYTNGNGRKLPGEPGNWWDNDPDPCDYKLRAPIEQYVRLLRISWEVIKTLDPESYVTLGDPGFPSFLDAVLRNTDNPDGGAVGPGFPYGGGAYFDCMTYHSYPHFDFSAYDPAINLFKRHSDGGADGLIVAKNRFQAILDQYGYDGVLYPKKLWNVTEFNAPRKALTGPWMQGETMQINYILKTLMRAKKEEITQMHIYNLFDVRNDADAIDEFDLMGMYTNNTGVLPYQQQVNPQGKAMRTFSLLLDNSVYDTTATIALNLPAGVRGHAFKLPNDSLIYALWAETTTDLSETASKTYDFPVSLGLDSLDVYHWDYGYTNASVVVSDSNIVLNGRPQFFRRKSVNNCLLTTAVSQITCFDNLTPLVSSDDKWSFQLLVEAAGGSAASRWVTTIGTDTLRGSYGTLQLIDTLDISQGALMLTVRDSSISTCSKTISITAPATCSVPPATSYCSSQSEFPWHDWIDKVKIGNINNPSSKSQYSDFTNISASLVAGQTYPATLSNGISWLEFDEYWRVWIDFNKNKVFEANEIVLQEVRLGGVSGSSQGSLVLNANLTIPANAANGTTRMRVSMRRGAYAGPCDLLSFGEVEDYTVNITAPVGTGCSINANISDVTCNDNGTPTIGSDDTYTFNALVTGSNTSAGWSVTTGTNAVSGSYGQARLLGPFSILQNVSLIFSDQGDPSCTTTADVVKPNPCSTGGGNGTYCTSTSDFPWHDWIAQIKVADLDHVTSKAPYTHYPDKIATVQRNATHVVQLTGGYSWMVEDEYWRIWIDYNRDGDFTSNEIAFSKFNPKSPFPVSLWSVNGTISIPDTVPTGITRMRIVMRRGNTPPDACGTYPFGETEDYSVNIVSGTSNTCAIFPSISSLSCQNKGTGSPADDTYSFDLLVTGAGSVSPLGWRATIGNTIVSGVYGQPKAVQNLLISAGNLSIAVRDSASATCAQTIAVTAPAPCSNNTGPCTSSSAFPWHDWIEGVKFANIDQTSNKSQYSDFTSNIAQVNTDSAYALRLTQGFSYFTYPEYWRIWVDGNNDGDWEPSEIVFEKAFQPTAQGVYSMVFNDTIQFIGVAPGLHKMRVVMRRDAFPDPCGTLDFGEVEDYQVQVAAPQLRTSVGSYKAQEIAFTQAWAAYPNPATDRFQVQFEQALKAEASLMVVDQLGQVLRKFDLRIGQKELDIETEGLANGIYFLQLNELGKRITIKRVVVLRE
jgi:hypothetical protein